MASVSYTNAPKAKMAHLELDYMYAVVRYVRVQAQDEIPITQDSSPPLVGNEPQM